MSWLLILFIIIAAGCLLWCIISDDREFAIIFSIFISIFTFGIFGCTVPIRINKSEVIPKVIVFYDDKVSAIISDSLVVTEDSFEVVNGYKNDKKLIVTQISRVNCYNYSFTSTYDISVEKEVSVEKDTKD